MNILQKLTLRHLRHNSKRTAITIIGIVLSVAMVTAVSGMTVSFQDLLYRDAVLREGLWHVRYSGVFSETAAQLVQEPVFSQWEWTQTEDGTALSLQFQRLHKGIFDESEEVCRKYGIDSGQVRYHNDLLIARGIVPGYYYGALYTFAGILLGLIAIGSVLVISNAFAISADQRSQQFGLLKSAGATKQQVRNMVLFEGIVLVLLSYPLGILVGLFAQWVALTIANGVLSSLATVNLSVLFRVVISPLVLFISAVAALFTVLVAAWFPAKQAANTSAVESIRQTRSIKLSKKQVRVSPLTQKLFGLEGALAAKAMGRNRGKYRATIIALVVSIVLFIGVSSFSSILLKATSLFYADMGSNVIISINEGIPADNDHIAREFSSWDGVKAHPSRHLSGSLRLPEEYITEQYRRYFPEATPTLRLFSIGEEDYRTLCRDLKIQPGSSPGQDQVDAILVNTSGAHIQQGRRVNFVPYHAPAGSEFHAYVGEQEFQLRVVGITPEIPPGIYDRFTTFNFNVIVSDQTLAQLWEEDNDYFWIATMADNAADFAAHAQAYLEQQLPGMGFHVMNFEQYAANNRAVVTLVMIFVYGFIAMLTLIGVTSVIATISTNISLRAGEFAMLRSVGMTERSIARMLRYESLLYGVKALLWGIPLGLLTCFLLYRAMTSAMDFPFIWPVESMLISIVAILLITFTTMTFARRKQRGMNIVEALRHNSL